MAIVESEKSKLIRDGIKFSPISISQEAAIYSAYSKIESILNPYERTPEPELERACVLLAAAVYISGKSPDTILLELSNFRGPVKFGQSWQESVIELHCLSGRFLDEKIAESMRSSDLNVNERRAEAYTLIPDLVQSLSKVREVEKLISPGTALNVMKRHNHTRLSVFEALNLAAEEIAREVP